MHANRTTKLRVVLILKNRVRTNVDGQEVQSSSHKARGCGSFGPIEISVYRNGSTVTAAILLVGSRMLQTQTLTSDLAIARSSRDNVPRLRTETSPKGTATGISLVRQWVCSIAKIKSPTIFHIGDIFSGKICQQRRRRLIIAALALLS